MEVNAIGAPGNPFAGAKASDFEVVESQPSGNGYDEQIDGGGDEGPAEVQQGESETQEPAVNNQEQNQPPIVENPQTPPATSQADQSAPAPTVPELSINDAIAKYSRTDLLKALGLDEYAIGVLDYYAANGSIDDYVTIKSIDFKSMAPVDLMKYKVRRDNPTLSDEGVEFIVRRNMERDYGISDNLDEDQRRVPMEVLSHDMEKVRQTLITEQSKFSAPPRQPEPVIDVEAERTAVLSNPVIKAAMDSKVLVVGPKDSPVNIQIDPGKIAPLLYDDAALDSAMQIKDASGKPTGQRDPSLGLKIAAMIADPEAYDNALIAYGKTLGKKQVVDADENLPDRTAEKGTPVPEENSLFDAFRRRARHTGGQY